jgi:hypothetical protein
MEQNPARLGPRPASRCQPARGCEETGMQALGTGDTFLFGGFRLDRRGLFRRDEREVFVRVAIGARALDVLCVLVAGDSGRGQ